jgi:hypothetical protein
MHAGCLRYKLALHNPVGMIAGRSLVPAHTTTMRRAMPFAPELVKR